jgi:hypothetical protein
MAEKGKKVHERGYFYAVVTGEQYPPTNETLEGLRKTLMERTKRKVAKVAVPASLIGRNREGWTVEAVTVTGIHSTRSDILIRRANGKADSLGGYNTADSLMQPLSKEDETLIVTLLTQKTQIDKQIREFNTAHTLPRRRIEQAIEAAMALMSDEAPLEKVEAPAEAAEIEEAAE